MESFVICGHNNRLRFRKKAGSGFFLNLNLILNLHLLEHPLGNEA